MRFCGCSTPLQSTTAPLPHVHPRWRHGRLSHSDTIHPCADRSMGASLPAGPPQPIAAPAWTRTQRRRSRWSCRRKSRVPNPTPASKRLDPRLKIKTYNAEKAFLLAVFSRVARLFPLQHSTNRLCLNLFLYWGPKEAGGGRRKEKRIEREGEKRGFSRSRRHPFLKRFGRGSMVAKGLAGKKIASGGARQPWWREELFRGDFAPPVR